MYTSVSRVSAVVVQSLSCVWHFVTPWTTTSQASLSFTIWSLRKLMSIEPVMPSNHISLSRSFLLLPSNFPSIRALSNELAPHIRWPKYWSFNLSISPSNQFFQDARWLWLHSPHRKLMHIDRLQRHEPLSRWNSCASCGQPTGNSWKLSWTTRAAQGRAPGDRSPRLGLILFRMDWFDLLAVPGTVRSLLQHHSWKASILQYSAFFMIQLSHPYMTTIKTIALTIQLFVSKVISLLFNMLSRLVIAFLPRSKCLLISWLQSLSTVILEPKKIKYVTISIVFPSICLVVTYLDMYIWSYVHMSRSLDIYSFNLKKNATVF